MATLDAVGHGTTLAGRYRVDHPLHRAPATAVWRAVDTALDRPVTIRFVAGPVAADVLDAARRASVVEDPRLLRVLDVGSETVTAPGGGSADVCYVVSEYAEGESLATRLQRGPLPASEARPLIGEAADALERARDAGLHHACLTPSSVVLPADGGVKVAGMAVDAALDAGTAETADGPGAARADAVGLVALLYAGLTGRWPLGEVDGLPAAPQLAGQPVPPADLVPGVPNDLDTLCAVTFGPHEDGPRTPGELAEQLAPWGRRPGAERDDPRHMRPAGRFPVRLAGTAGAVGAAAAAAATAAGMRRDPQAPEGSERLFDDGAVPSAAAASRVDRPAREPAPPPEEADPGRSGRSAQPVIVLAAVAVLVVLGLVFAVGSLRTVGGGDPGAAPAPAPQQAAPPPTSEPAEGTTEGTAEPEPTPQATPQIQGVRTLDPQGDDGVENDEQAPLAIDGDPGTAWTSSTYTTAEFGNLKDGVGMVVDLGRPTAVSGVDLLVDGTGGEVEVRAADGPDLDGSQVVATASVDGEPVEVSLEEPVETRYVVLWFTRLPDTGDGYRVELAEVQVR